MRLPPIAPLNRREAQSIRRMRSGLDAIDAGPPGSETRALMEAMHAALDDALSEYQARPWYRRWITPPSGHRTRLLPWALEIQSEVARRLGQQ